jgi:hypothetical protein
MVLANMLVNTVDSALQDRKVAFNGVRVRVAPDIFVRRMNNSPVAGKLLADILVNATFIRAKVRIG